MIIEPRFGQIETIRGICQPWITQWGGDEWGDSMYSLHAAAQTCYGLDDNDCAILAKMLIENIISMHEWVQVEGKDLGFWDPDNVAATQSECRERRAYWLKCAPEDATKVLASVPRWMFGE